jgi:hypothetical protein
MAALEKRKYYEEFKEWFDDGHVIKFKDGYATQDALYRNRLESKEKLYEYFVKEFMNQ